MFESVQVRNHLRITQRLPSSHQGCHGFKFTSQKTRKDRLNVATRRASNISIIALAAPPGRSCSRGIRASGDLTRLPLVSGDPLPSRRARATWPRAPGSPLNVALVRQVIVEHLEAGRGFQVSETHGVGWNREPSKSGGIERQKHAASAEGKKGPSRPEKSLYRDGGVSLHCTG